MYRIPIKSRGIKKNQISGMHIMAALLFIGMGAIAFIAPFLLRLALISKDYHPVIVYNWINWMGIFYIALGVIIITITLFFNKKLHHPQLNFTLRITEIIGFLLVIIYSAYMQWTLPVAYGCVGLLGIIIVLILEKKATKQQYVIFDNNGISIQDYTKNKQIKWQNINNIILKSNVLSVDNRNNTFYQLETVGSISKISSELIAFCNEKIESHQHLYQPDWL